MEALKNESAKYSVVGPLLNSETNHLTLVQTPKDTDPNEEKDSGAEPDSGSTDQNFNRSNMDLFMDDVEKGQKETWPEMGIKEGLLTHANEIRLFQTYQMDKWLSNFIDTHQDLPLSPQASELITFNRANIARARNLLADKNYRLVVNFSRHFLGRGLGLLDLIQAGNEGLLRAIEKFEWRRGYRFSTYATWWIKQSLRRTSANEGRTIRLPVHVGEALREMAAVERDLMASLGREPTIDEMATSLAPDKDNHKQIKKRIIEIRRGAMNLSSLDDPVGEDGDTARGDLVADMATKPFEEIAAQNELREKINRVLDNLSERERRILQLRFGLEDGRNRSLDEVGKEFGVSRERIRQVEAKAMRKLRHPSKAKILRPFLDSFD